MVQRCKLCFLVMIELVNLRTKFYVGKTYVLMEFKLFGYLNRSPTPISCKIGTCLELVVHIELPSVKTTIFSNLQPELRPLCSVFVKYINVNGG